MLLKSHNKCGHYTGLRSYISRCDPFGGHVHDFAAGLDGNAESNDTPAATSVAGDLFLEIITVNLVSSGERHEGDTAAQHLFPP